MKIDPESDINDELRPEYDLTQLKNRVRGKYAQRFNEASQVGPVTPTVQLEPDVAEVFPDAATVNAALRFLIKTTRENPLVVGVTS